MKSSVVVLLVASVLAFVALAIKQSTQAQSAIGNDVGTESAKQEGLPIFVTNNVPVVIDVV